MHSLLLTFYCMSSVLRRFLRYNLELVPTVNWLIDEAHIGFFSMIPSYFEIEIMALRTPVAKLVVTGFEYNFGQTWLIIIINGPYGRQGVNNVCEFSFFFGLLSPEFRFSSIY